MSAGQDEEVAGERPAVILADGCIIEHGCEHIGRMLRARLRQRAGEQAPLQSLHNSRAVPGQTHPTKPETMLREVNKSVHSLDANKQRRSKFLILTPIGPRQDDSFTRQRTDRHGAALAHHFISALEPRYSPIPVINDSRLISIVST
jgi:hypothetical protein